ncbi:GxxExxY protein [Gemmata sp. JC717]|uniref:GxxExxY protein n=1 Tax=Gemmata algarum TaxID=2975278 RepID=UPI0021BA4E08|nr:GxxExxY protein [Gemmata algarum]MDY3554640.1 GxxExxY protein [Gemmata algarum]
MATKTHKGHKRKPKEKSVQKAEDERAQKKTKREVEMKAWSNVFELCDIIRETGYAIHAFLRNGHLEKVYENALVNRLRKQGVYVEPQHPLSVRDEDGTVLGEFVADLFVERTLIVELKAVRHVVDEHIAQLLGYLRCSGVEHGLLMNFGGQHFYVKKFILNDAF